MTDLTVQYLGMKLNSPIVVASTPLSESVGNVRRMEDAGAAAIVLTSLFEEQLEMEARALDEDLSRGTESFAESLHYLPNLSDYRMSHDVYLDYLRRTKEAVRIPVLASLNGSTAGGWIRFAKDMEQAGADAIELNTFALATDSGEDSAAIEQRMIDLVGSVCKTVAIPVAVKLSQLYTSIPAMASRLEKAGARALVLFNRFYQPEFDIEGLEVKPTLHFSSSSELLPRLHWAAILYGNVNVDIAITGGVHSAEDVLKACMAGGTVTEMASALHLHGIEHIGRVLADLTYWLEKHDYASYGEIRGCLSRRSAPDASPFDRGNYIKTLSSYSMRQTRAAF